MYEKLGGMLMPEKRLPIVIDNYVKSECWTQLLLSVIQTSPHAPMWIAAHIGIIGSENMHFWYGNLSKVFSFRNALDILHFEEVLPRSVPPERIVDFLREEINRDNYIVVELKRPSGNEKGYWIHEQLIFGYSDTDRVFYGSALDNKTGSFVEIRISYETLLSYYFDSYTYFQAPENKSEYIYWSRSNFLISRMRLREDYVPHGWVYDMLQNIVIEADGKAYTAVQYDGDRNVIGENKMYTGAACILAAEQHMEKFLHDRHFIEKDTDIEYNDLFGQLAYHLAKGFYKLYEHRKMILDSLRCLYTLAEIPAYNAEGNVAEYAQCCKDMDIFYKKALKFHKLRDWSILEELKQNFSGQYKKEHRILNQLVLEIKDIWHSSQLQELI